MTTPFRKFSELRDAMPPERQEASRERAAAILAGTIKPLIVCDPEIHGGDPIIRGTRIQVRAITGQLAARVTIEELLADYPKLTPEAIDAAVAYGETA